MEILFKSCKSCLNVGFESRLAVLLKRVRQLTRDLVRVAAFDLISLQHINQLAVLQQCDGVGIEQVTSFPS